MKAKRKNDEIRRYRSDRAWVLFHILFGFVWGFSGIMLLYISVSASLPIFIFGCPLLLYVSCRTFRYSYRLANKTYLLVTPSRLEFANSSYNGMVTWEQLTCITRIHYRINNHQTSHNWYGYSFDWWGDGFLLDEKQSFQSVEDVPPILTQSIPIGNCVSIPRRYRVFGDIDWDKFATTLFGRDLLHYAPHLFEGKLSEKAKIYPES